MMRNIIVILALTSFLCLPTDLQAHVISGSGFTNGLAHPLFGLDHLLAMVAVGILGAKIGGKAIYLLPCTFIFSMMIGLGTFFINISPPLTEIGINGSLIYFGILIALAKEMKLTSTLGGVAFFAFFHGHSHGEEWFIVHHATAYFAGLLLMTALLHISGVGLGILGRKHFTIQKALQLSGFTMSALGVYFLLPNL